MQLQQVLEQPYTTTKPISASFPRQRIQDGDNKSLQTACASEPAQERQFCSQSTIPCLTFWPQEAFSLLPEGYPFSLLVYEV